MITLAKVDICNPEGVRKRSFLSFDRKVIIRGGGIKDTFIPLKGYTVYPSLINSHDHLLGCYLPRVGNGPYLSWKAWDDDLKSSSLYKERSRLSHDDIYELAYYRQIFSGVTTVSDHIPHRISDPYKNTTFVRIINDYALAHELSSYELRWGGALDMEIAKAKKRNIPFITHIEEGYDEESKQGVPFLFKEGGLFDRTVLIHCIGCDKRDIELIGKSGSHMVWCPSSNMYMFNDTADVRTFLQYDINVALGTDSPMSGGMNLLEEMKSAKKIYKQKYGEKIDSQRIFQMCTINGARAFNLEDKIGSLEEGKSADMIVLKNKPFSNVYDRIVNAEMEDIEFVLKEGVPLFGKTKYKKFFHIDPSKYQDVKLKERYPYFVIGRPMGIKERINRKVGFNKFFAFFPIEAPV